MSTLVLDLYTKAYPSITNRIKCSVLELSSPFAVVASIIDTTVGHPERFYNFSGLPRNTYKVSLDEIDGAGLPINNLALFSVTPGALGNVLSRDDEQIQVDVTTGLVSGTTSFTFDGTGGKPDYIGWEIVPTEQAGGRGLAVRGVDYSWDSITGTFTLLQPGDTLNSMAYWNIHFNPINQTAGGSQPTVTDFQINYLQVDTTLDDTYFGKKLIVEPTGVYTEITLPNIDTVVSGRKMMVEITGSSNLCVKFIPFGSNVINWLRGNIYACANESFSIYKFVNPNTLDPEWRICEAEGNFKTVGQEIAHDAVISDLFNCHEYDGSDLDVEQYSRLYNEFVLQLPSSQRVDYDAWGLTGTLNKYFFSAANSSNPSNAGKFKCPLRKGLFERNNSTGKAGDWFDESIKSSGQTLTLPLVRHDVSGPNFGITDGIPGGSGSATVNVTIGSGTETRPKHILINKYFLT